MSERLTAERIFDVLCESEWNEEIVMVQSAANEINQELDALYALKEHIEEFLAETEKGNSTGRITLLELSNSLRCALGLELVNA